MTSLKYLMQLPNKLEKNHILVNVVKIGQEQTVQKYWLQLPLLLMKLLAIKPIILIKKGHCVTKIYS